MPSLDAVWRAGDVACSARVWRLRLPAAFLVVYLVWGGTYAAIRVGVTAVPPAMLSGLRFVIAGMCMTGYALARGHRLPDTRREWLQLLLLGLTMIVFSNGLVTWAEQYVPSNQSALIVTSSALWTAWLGTFGPNGHPLSALEARPRRRLRGCRAALLAARRARCGVARRTARAARVGAQLGERKHLCA